MPRVNAQQWLDKHLRNTQNAIPDIQRGIESVQTAPGQAAAANADRMLAGVQEAVSSGRWAQRVSAVPLADWKALTIQKGLNRIVPGIQAAQNKNRPKIEKLLAVEGNIEAEVHAMDKGTFQARVQRSVQWQTRMHEAKMSGQL